MESMVNNLWSSWDTLSQATASTGGDVDAASVASKQSPQESKMAASSMIWSSFSEPQKTPPAKRASSSFFDDIFASSKDHSTTLTDKMFERFLSMALPTTTTQDGEELQSILERIEMQKSRPQLSLNVMSKNAIQLLSRLSVPFVLIDQVIIIFSWSKPLYTLTFLNVATLLILKPILLLSLPFFYTCFEIIVPAYMKRHPPDKHTILQNRNPIPAEGPSVSHVDVPRPVPELSREFVLNSTDLQNHMLLYVMTYDFVTSLIVKYLYFKDENITIFIFVCLLTSGTLLTLFGAQVLSTMLPFIKVTLSVGLWAATIAMHPDYRSTLLDMLYSEDTRLRLLMMSNRLELWLNKELNLREQKEVKEAEIFELQHLDPETHNWQLICFSSDPYPANSHARLNNLLLVGTLHLSQVKPPEGWKFVDVETAVNTRSVDGWLLDLTPEGWIKENFLNETMDIDEDEKWCYDLVTKFSYQAGLTTNEKKTRGEVRRRRWIRYCVRDIWDEDDQTEEKASHRRNKSVESANNLHPVKSIDSVDG
ncbi:hypothetical protein KL942_004935 [Ogataea angusta]|uniref:TECPR1-like DysF domain-containing protein n=1 Tax=Pichia angusta TaxID=870730 RepID=A0ABQ7RQV8_PICAN|nr:hypothetical protein KL909_004333 [Ogataea angusta]KAG7835765.1 hypothetical protein KL942_004935 [Ogataea angusta]KAG7845960.1 hypothetical protein KL940_004799 [Ogataea angusta]KAG7855114.1 hypothetical protein KL919_004881 [Ogataea angusta]